MKIDFNFLEPPNLKFLDHTNIKNPDTRMTWDLLFHALLPSEPNPVPLPETDALWHLSESKVFFVALILKLTIVLPTTKDH